MYILKYFIGVRVLGIKKSDYIKLDHDGLALRSNIMYGDNVAIGKT